MNKDKCDLNVLFKFELKGLNYIVYEENKKIFANAYSYNDDEIILEEIKNDEVYDVIDMIVKKYGCELL